MENDIKCNLSLEEALKRQIIFADPSVKSRIDSDPDAFKKLVEM